MSNIIFNPTQTGEKVFDFSMELLAALDHMFLSIVKVNLNNGKAWLLHSLKQQNRQCYEFDWQDYLNFYQDILEKEEGQKLWTTFSITQLNEYFLQGNQQYRMEFLCKAETNLDWLEIIAQLDCKDNQPFAYIFTRQSGDSILLRRIIDLYVYNNCDYFIYLDAKKNSYTMFSASKNGTPLPPSICNDYSSEIIKYANDFVVPEDREMVIREMSLERVLSVLEHQDVHAFTCGVWQEGVGYTHKRLEYRYYNKAQQMILLSRSDITEIYNEQVQHAQDLEEALERALSDPLTGLLNYQGIRSAVKKELSHLKQMSALLFLDLDDFKSINDKHGHATGDYALQSVATILKDNIRSSDYAARIGGDEFVIFLNHLHNIEEAAHCAQRICEQIVKTQLGDFQLSCSIGISFAPRDGMDYMDLVKAADRKVYEAKSYGKNQYAL